MRKQILSMGEALVDVLPADGGLWRPVPGGSSYNVALALGRLGAPAAFVGRLSRDEQGRGMRATLTEEGVLTRFVSCDERPSPLSLVERGSQTGSARFSIHLADTAHAPPDLPPDWLDQARHLHVSSFSALVGAWGDAVGAALDEARGRVTRSFDVNIRPNLLPGRQATRKLVAARLKQVEYLKASEDDLRWLFPDADPGDVAADWSRSGPVAILTRGAGGASVFVRGAAFSRPAPSLTPLDTVGAGDAFMGAFLSRALELGALARPAGYGADLLGALLDYANAAAALCCTRAGADAPRRTEVEDFLHHARPRA
ncbi:MAG: carbohydrate kinase family protein [Rhodoblastus sp.]